MNRMLDGVLSLFEAELAAHAQSLFDWWRSIETADGFLPEVDAAGVARPDAGHSIILSTRLLWYFSAYGRIAGNVEALRLADKALKRLRTHFLDETYGGFLWALNADASPSASHKQAYAQAFGIYALAEHYAASGEASSLELARRLFRLLERHYRDAVHGGYIEALSRNFTPVSDQRLSDKDLNAPKSMNTHLHVLEAYARLHQVAPTSETEAALGYVLDLFCNHIVDADTGHLRLFFDMDWRSQSAHVSYGHDIEASWLLWEAAEALGDPVRLAAFRPICLRIAGATGAGGMGRDGGVYYEADAEGGALNAVGEWWGQAEALVGFLNAYELSGDEAHLLRAWSVWSFVKLRHLPEGHGEWSWYPEGSGRTNPYLAGAWKCPYHNGRALMEGVGRLKRLTACPEPRAAAL